MPLESIVKFFSIESIVSSMKKRMNLSNERMFPKISNKYIDSIIEQKKHEAIKLAYKSGVDPFRIL